ncbi:branched-chain amino acid ABC transporter permease [Phytomonospora endophytica]|uniref:Branched-chain amino acid transport system permease protein n=1 Tax=Phytomonospora endophytica TaxID=714109 RepID=A0A841FUR4_9ACTN|nr:branched-chain amino acid ABC transporter permease [Phytomonospora endophytica]MBB6037292.1 branched-chain amino acid transport system permease protein [Phytomonospora endophytica]GIG69964.1 ABC transporter ATP-binding protein [Phytomonospora endophytica]
MIPTRLRTPLGIAAAVVAVAALLLLPTVADNYTLITVSRVAGLGLLAASTALMTGVAGLPTLGQIAPYAVGAYTAAHLAHLALPGLVQLLGAAAAAAVFSLATGAAVVQTRGVICLMVTLAIGELTAITAGQWTSLTGGTDGMPRVPATPALPGGENLVKVPDVYTYTVVAALAVLAVTMLVLRSPAGTLIRGCRDNEARMRASGHRVSLTLLWTFTGAGAIAGAGGALLVSSQRTVSPSNVGFEVAALVLLAVVIGGAASIPGALAGVAAVVAVRDTIAPKLPGEAPLLLGVLFIAAVYLLPGGLSGVAARLGLHNGEAGA